MLEQFMEFLSWSVCEQSWQAGLEELGLSWILIPLQVGIPSFNNLKVLFEELVAIMFFSMPVLLKTDWEPAYISLWKSGWKNLQDGSLS